MYGKAYRPGLTINKKMSSINLTFSPHYYYPVSSMNRVHTLGSQGVNYEEFDARIEELERIKEYAFKTWSKPDRAATTYRQNHNEKYLNEPTLCRPSSPYRTNKPHPSNSFLVNRLSDVQLEKGHDAISQGPLPQYLRPKESVRIQKIAEIVEKNVLREPLAPTESQALSSWLRLANHKDRVELLNEAEEKGYSGTTGNLLVDPFGNKRFGGVKQHRGALSRLQLTLGSNPDKHPCPPLPRHHRDFCIHPDWPPSLYHHRIHLPDFRRKTMTR